MSHINSMADETLIQFADQILRHAITQHISDIHIEPYENMCRIRYRQDGILSEITTIPPSLASRLMARLKVMAKLDIAEKRLPQDGRFQVNKMDFRISTCPTLFGEKVVLRLLDTNKSSLKINELGLNKKQEAIFMNKLSQSHGFILVTGPTGSGKTVTLYSALRFLNTPEKNISTVEDPVEIQVHGINQVNINTKIHLDFATVLRALLRQDPDIIMLGEIRDTETAKIALQAAQTGHLVLATLHTNNTTEAIYRLQSMGVATYHIASAISLIIAQRLVRQLCPHCKIIDRSMQSSDPQHPPLFQAVGCQHCLQGYSGRSGIYELLPITENIIQSMTANASSFIIREQAKQEGLVTLKEAGLEKVMQGMTSLSELTRVLS